MPRTPLAPGHPRGWAPRRDPEVTEQQDGRAGFGNRLRRLREDAELSGKQLAQVLGWPASKVSRLENGRQTATVADVRAWTSALGARDPVCDELIEDLRSLRIEYATWQRQLRSGLAPRQRVGHVLDEGATTLRALQHALVPGLLQTSDYTRAVFLGLVGIYGGRDIEAAVHERARRQELLYDDHRDLRFVITESALRARVCPYPVHRAQLDRLLVLAGLQSVQLAVLPWSVSLPKAVTHGFDLFDDRLVLVETINAELAIRDPEDIALYARVFEMYWDVAAHSEAASSLITRVALELPRD